MAEPEPIHSTGDDDSEAESFSANGKSRQDEKKEEKEKSKKEAEAKKDKESQEAEERDRGQKLAFRDAELIAKVVSQIIDERLVVLHPKELEYFGKILVKYGGFEPAEVARWIENQDPQLVINAHAILQKLEIAEAEDTDWRYPKDSPNRKVVEKFVRGEMKKVKSLRSGELNASNVRKYVIVEEFDKFDKRKMGGPGTAEAGDGQGGEIVPESSNVIRETLSVMVTLVSEGRNVASDEQWVKLKGIFEQKVNEFNQAVAQKKFLVVYDFVKAIDEVVHITPLGKLSYLKVILPDESVDEFRTKMSVLDDEFQLAYDKMDDKTRTIVFEDLRLAMGTDLQGILAGWRDAEDVRSHIFGGGLDRLGRPTEGVVAKGASREKAIGLEGIREWLATRDIYGAEERVTSELLTRPPARWEEVPESLSNVYRLIESTDFTVEDLGHEIQKALAMLDSLRPTTQETRELRNRLGKELEAFRAFHSMRVTMERFDMDPKKLPEVFQNYFDDETWETFASRFAKDERRRDFKDREGNGVNVFDVSFNLYADRLRFDRIRMNIVEELTRHEIGNKISAGTLLKIQEGAGMWNADGTKSDFFPMSEAEFNKEVEGMRSFFKTKMEGKIADKNLKLPVDEVWGRKRKFSEEVTGIGITKDVIVDWHTKKTLQGAFGNVTDKDVSELMDEFGIDDREEARKRFLGKSFLNIRREQMREELKKRLSDMGLLIKPEKGDARPADIDALVRSGFLESADANSYYAAWMMMWSNYDSVRIYSRDHKTNLDDDFVSLAFHKSTNMFFGRAIDHTWEFYHDTNENRGRAKENDVNRIWKQTLPGKHHYLFPQNIAMVRWAGNFMNDKQKQYVEKRTQELMLQNDFDNQKYHDEYYSWMKSVAIMDMIENGQLTFSRTGFSDVAAAYSSKNFSNAAEEGAIKKFEMVDLYVDRGKHWDYASPQAFQAYLANPTEDKFAEINDKEKVFYSTRSARQFPWMTLAMRAHWEIANHHSLRLFDRPNLPAGTMENVVKNLVENGHVEKEQGNDFKRRYLALLPFVEKGLSPSRRHELEFLGTVPFRRLRQASEIARRLAWESKFSPLVILLSVLAAMGIDFARRLPSQAFDQGR